jgi:hypothetical protein
MEVPGIPLAFSGALALLAASLCACGSTGPRRPATPIERADVSAPADRAPAPRPNVGAVPPRDEILVAGERVPIGAPVVTWLDIGGYDAHSTELRFPELAPEKPARGLRYRPGRARVDDQPGDAAATAAGGARPTRAELEDLVDQFVIHYDACGLASTCFRVLHDQRGLSVHFLLDLDGTLYQTLDLADTAWHATRSNPRSVGIEIANVGAYPPGSPSPLDEWYAADSLGPRVVIPIRLGDGGLRLRDHVARPVRPERVRGAIQGQELEMFDLTPAQYESLARLTAALSHVFPQLRLEVPRYADGEHAGAVRREALSDEEWASHRGLLGHLHVQANKHDPGPAFDWERLLRRARALASRPPRYAAP